MKFVLFYEKVSIMKIHVEVFITSRISGKKQGTLTFQDLINCIQREFKDERPGVSTQVLAACIANAPLNHALGYNYLWRIKPGLLRIFHPAQDKPNPERIKHASQPRLEDVPERYQNLLIGL